MKTEKQQLIDVLLDGASRRETILLAATKILRRRRQWCAACRAFALILLATVTVRLVAQNRRPPTLAQISRAATKPAAPFQAQSLPEEELLALFPNTPVGLATLPNGKKRLRFPRPGDAAKFITRL